MLGRSPTFSAVSSRRASWEKSSDDCFSRVHRPRSRGLRALRGDAVDVAVGLVELAHDVVVVHRIGIARQHREDFAQAGLLAAAARRSGGG